MKDAPRVSPLSNLPAVLKGITPAPSSWLTPSLNWYADPRNWSVELAQSGPSSWPRQSVGAAHPKTVTVPATTVTHTRLTDSSVTFDMYHAGTAVLVNM